MKEAVAKQWSKALRSGKYTQGKGKLRTKNDTYCCLGVLCDLGKTTWTVTFGNNLADGKANYLPLSVKCWSGMDSTIGRFGPAIRDTLASENDRPDSSFEKIAKLIDKHWKEL